MPNKQCLIIFAKAPLPGFAKTRLIPALGAENAALLQEQLISRTLARVTASHDYDTHLYCSPTSDHPAFNLNPNISLFNQQGSDLGEKMDHALSQTLRSYDSAVLIGTDCPALDPKIISQAFYQLGLENDAVIGPALDGGYYLVGLNKTNPALFKEISWGSKQVLSQTRNKLKLLDWSWFETTPLNDIDRPEDIQLLKDFPDIKTLLTDDHSCPF